MNLFIMYMAGNTISIFPTMMVCMMAWRPIQALMAISATFKMLESSSQKFLQGLVYLIGNLMGLALAVYKCQSMGLLPTHASDWLAFIEPPEVRLMFQANGIHGSFDGRIRVGVESSLIFFKALFLPLHVYCMPVCMCVCVVEVREQLAGVGFFLLYRRNSIEN
ncbi:ER membrane protein complex subunit 4 [Lemmus lemmus]